MKKLSKIILIMSLLFLIPITANAERKIKLIIGGKEIKSDVNPVIIDGRTMLPVRTVFEAIGAMVEYDNSTKTITAVKKDTTVRITIGNSFMFVNDEEKPLDVPAVIQNSRTLIPVRACAEAFGLDVQWLEESKTVKIKTNVSVISKKYDSNGKTESWLYDENGNLSSHGSTTYKYDDLGNLIYEQTNVYWKEYTYNKYNDLIKEKYLNPTTGYVNTITFDYDDNGNLIYEDNELTTIKYTYDDSGKILCKESSNGSYIKYNYDIWGNLVYEELNNNWFKFAYDQWANRVYEEWKDGHWKKYSYNENGLEIFKEWNDNVDIGWRKSEYDDNSRLVYEEYSAGGKRYYTYNAFGKLDKIEVGNGIVIESYAYDENGNLTLHNTTDTTEEYIVVYK